MSGKVRILQSQFKYFYSQESFSVYLCWKSSDLLFTSRPWLFLFVAVAVLFFHVMLCSVFFLFYSILFCSILVCPVLFCSHLFLFFLQFDCFVLFLLHCTTPYHIVFHICFIFFSFQFDPPSIIQTYINIAPLPLCFIISPWHFKFIPLLQIIIICILSSSSSSLYHYFLYLHVWLLSVCLYVCLSAYLSVCVYLSGCLVVCLSVCLSLSGCLVVCLFVCLSICPSIYLSVCLSVFQSDKSLSNSILHIIKTSFDTFTIFILFSCWYLLITRVFWMS